MLIQEVSKIHATWAFLVDANDVEHVDVNNITEFWGDYYHREFEDGDNWYLPEVLVFEDGRVVPLCEDGAYRGTDHMWKQLVNTSPVVRWDWALRFATSLVAVAFDLNFMWRSYFGEERNQARMDFDDMNREEIIEALKEWIPQRLSWASESIRGEQPPEPSYDRNNPDREARQRDWEVWHDWNIKYGEFPAMEAVNMAYRFMQAQRWDRRYNIFCGRCNIREHYRAIQLNEVAYFPEGHEHAKELAIMFFDYHY